MKYAFIIVRYAVPFLLVPLLIIWLLLAQSEAPVTNFVWAILAALLLVNLISLYLVVRKRSTYLLDKPHDVTQEELLTAISDAKIGYAVLNRTGEILYASKSASFLMGFSDERDITGLVWYNIDHENRTLKEAREQNWKKYIAERTTWNGIVRWVSEEGKKSYYDYTICSAGIDRIILVVIDRSDRIRANRELQEREKLHNYILNNLPVGITLHDINQKIIYTNNYIPSRLGISLGEARDKYPEQLLTEGTVDVMSEMYSYVLRTQKPVEGRTMAVTEGPLAGTHWLLFMYPFFTKGKLDRVLVVSLDRTERVRLAQEKEQFSRKLYESQKIEALNKFAGGLAHELSNLLHPAGVYARALREDPNLDDREKYLTLINTAVLKSGEILRQTLSMSRSDQDAPRPLELGGFLDELVAYANDIAPKGLSYELLNQHAPVSALADETGLRQVMMNLMNNAADAQNRTGNIVITVGKGGLPPPDASLTPTRAGPYAWIDVTDQGVGMDAETRLHIFDAFFTTKEKEKGTGLGLPVVQGIVTGWGGIVSVDTGPGKGSTFRVWIPLAYGNTQPVTQGEIDHGQNIAH